MQTAALAQWAVSVLLSPANMIVQRRQKTSRLMERLFEIIHEDAELLVINKPAGLVCHPPRGDVYSSLISRVRLHLGADTPAHLVNRLDRETSGLVLVAKSDEAAKSVRRIWEKRQVQKMYWAIVHGHV